MSIIAGMTNLGSMPGNKCKAEKAMHVTIKVKATDRMA
jgi:hypothetical protein